MVKKSVKTLLLVCATGIALSRCNSTPTKSAADLSQERAELRSSEQFIPVIEFDKLALPLVYERSADPYSTQKGRIDKQSIMQFIEINRLYQGGNLVDAEAAATNLTLSEPTLSGPFVVLGDIAVDKNDFASAELHYAKAIETNNKNINAYLKLALVQRQQGKYLPAQNTLVYALETWPDFPEAHKNIAIIYDLYLNHPIRAQRHLEAYQFLTDGKDAQAQQWLDEIQSRSGLAINLQVGADQRPELEQADE